MSIEVVIAFSNEEVANKLKNILIASGYSIVAICTSGNELIRTIRNLSPSLVVLGYKFKDMTLLDIYDATQELCNFLAIVNEPYKSFVIEETDIYCISSPINQLVLVNSIEMIMQSSKKLTKLKKQVDLLENKIYERKIVEKAKGILMRTLSLTENEAFRYIQKSSMDTGAKMIEVSEKIIKYNK